MTATTILEGDVLTQLRRLGNESVQTVVTSPPYWGAIRDYGVAGQLGLEPTLAEFLDRMLGVFSEVKRVLRPDGTLWLNMGDCYYGGRSFVGKGGDLGKVGEGEHGDGNYARRARYHSAEAKAASRALYGRREFKPKDLVGQGWALAFALRDRQGWWLRSDVVWHKPNPQPESVVDRPVRSHEFMFLMSKSARYFYDAVAVREPAKATDRAGRRQRKTNGKWQDAEGADREWQPEAGVLERHLRDVWTIPPHRFKGAHFATFPPRLVEPCIKAGTSEGGACAECGKPLVRVTERSYVELEGAEGGPKNRRDEATTDTAQTLKAGMIRSGCGKPRAAVVETLGFRRACEHVEAGTRPCLVLDPFAGSGTTLEVAAKLGRDAVGCELKPEYAAMARARLAAIGSV